MTTMVLPAFSGCLARRTATAAAAPLEMPDRMPSSLRQAARVDDRLLVGDLLDRVDQREIEHIGHEARADALDLVRAGLERLAGALLGQDRARGGLHRHRKDRLALGVLDVARDAGDRAAGADAGDENVDRAVGVVPDLRTGGLFVDRRIGRVLELLQQHVTIAGRTPRSPRLWRPRRACPSAPSVSTSLAP